MIRHFKRPMRQTDYQNFDLEFHKTTGGHKVKVRALAGEATHKLVLPFTPAQAQAFVVELENGLAANTIASARVKEWGGNLYEAVFAKDVRAIYKSSLDLINAKGGAGLRLRLHLQDAVELSPLPWEFLYQAATNQFLCLNRQIQRTCRRWKSITKRIKSKLRLAISLPGSLWKSLSLKSLRLRSCRKPCGKPSFISSISSAMVILTRRRTKVYWRLKMKTKPPTT
jgi:hypothetical protein